MNVLNLIATTLGLVVSFLVGYLIGDSINDDCTVENEKDHYLYKKGYADGCKDILQERQYLENDVLVTKEAIEIISKQLHNIQE